MFTIHDFILKYEKYSDEELMNIHANIADYSTEAQQALDRVIESRGGLEKIWEKLNASQILQDEANRIAKETHDFGSKGIDLDFIQTVTKSELLSEENVSEIINRQYKKASNEFEDKQVTSKTILRSVLGGGLASIVGGTLWGLQLIYSRRIYFIMGIALVLLCYGIIKSVTGKSKQNTAVFF